jgi:hypothetical protein
MDSPTLATTQAAMILSGHEAANGRDSRAWIYSGMAVQMATDLGLHLNIGLDGKYLDVVTDLERVVALRNNIFWVVYASNTYASLYCRQPALPNNSFLQFGAQALDLSWSGLHSKVSQVSQHIQWSPRSYVQIPLHNTNFAHSNNV